MRGNLQDGQRPVEWDYSAFRSGEILRVMNRQSIVDTVPKVSEPCQVHGFRHFTLYISLKSTGAPDDIHIEPEFLNDDNGQWHSYKQGLFATLFYEDTDCATEIHEVFNGDCAGRDVRFQVTGAGTTAQAYFDIQLSVEFWN